MLFFLLVKHFLLFSIFFLLFLQCKQAAYYRFKSPYRQQFEAAPANTATDDADSLSRYYLDDSSGRYFSGKRVEEPVFAAAQPKRLTLLAPPIAKDSSIHVLPPEQVFADSSQAVINKKPELKPNALAHVSFFSGVALILLYLFPFYVPILSPVLAILLPISAIVTGKIAVRQMAKRNESGRALAIFGMVVGSLAFLLALLIFLYIIGTSQKADSLVP